MGSLRAVVVIALLAAVASVGCFLYSPVDRTLLSSPAMKLESREAHRDLAEVGGGLGDLDGSGAPDSGGATGGGTAPPPC